MQLLRYENWGIKNIKAMYFHEFIYKTYSALLILVFFFVRDEQKMALALFLISHFIQNIWSKTTLPSLVSIQQAASEQRELFFLGVHLLLCLSPEQRGAQAQIFHVPSQKLDPALCAPSVLQTGLFGQAELVDLAGNTLLKALVQVKNGI